MNEFFTLLAGLPVPIAITIIVLLIIGYTVHKKLNCEDLYSKIQDCKQKHQSQLWGYISDQLGIIEAHSMNKAEAIIDKSPDLECERKCGVDPKQSQLNFFSMVLERTLHHDIFEKLKTAIRQNGFFEMDEKELESYIEEKAETLLRHSRKKINQRVYFFPILKGTDEERFTKDEAIRFCGKIIRKAIAVKKDEIKDIKEIREKYSIVKKLNLIGALIKKIKG